ncbi:MAG: energy transducer TonB [Bacteroidia bacterium]
MEGSVHLFLDINNRGEVTHVKVISGIGHGCDEEAVRVVKLMKFAVEKVRNMHVVDHQKIQIHFKLPKAVAAPLPNVLPQNTSAGVEYNYVIIPAKPKIKPTEKKEEKPKTIYTYNI